MENIESQQLKRVPESTRTRIALLAAYDKFQSLKTNWITQCCSEHSSSKPRPEPDYDVNVTNLTKSVKTWAKAHKCSTLNRRDFKSNEYFAKHLIEIHEEFCNFCYSKVNPVIFSDHGTQIRPITHNRGTQCDITKAFANCHNKNTQCEISVCDKGTQSVNIRHDKNNQCKDASPNAYSIQPYEQEMKKNTLFSNSIDETFSFGYDAVSSTTKLSECQKTLQAALKKSSEEPFRQRLFKRLKVDYSLPSTSNGPNVMIEEPSQFEEKCPDGSIQD